LCASFTARAISQTLRTKADSQFKSRGRFLPNGQLQANPSRHLFHSVPMSIWSAHQFARGRRADKHRIAEWFRTRNTRVPCYEDPEFTFSDVESEIQREVRNRNYLPRYQLRLAEEQRAGELILLERLEGRYRSQRKEPEERPVSTPPRESSETVAPVQGLLF
jgi:hypothetical protein